MKNGFYGLAMLFCLLLATPAQAQFAMSEVILDFGPDAPRQKDIEIVSHSKEVQYIASETYVLQHPTETDEKRQLVKDPQKSGLLITPAKMVLPPDGRKLMRFLLIHPQTDEDQIYRVAVKPVVQGIDGGNQRMALKLLVGYEALVIVRPKNAKIDLVANRKGNALTLTNNGNTNAYIQSGTQCDATGGDCKEINIARIYAGQSWTTTLPHLDGVVKLQVWDGVKAQYLNF